MAIGSAEVAEVRAMARSLSSLISNATDAELDAAIQKHAEPRTRLYLISATDGSGAHIFYADLEDLANNASTVEGLVNQVFDEPSVKSSLFRVMAAFSAAWVINAKVGIIESQQRIAYALEKQALADLDRLTKSPIIKSAVASAIAKMREGLNYATTLLIAQDLNPVGKDDTKKLAPPYAGAQLPYVGATVAGRARLWVNGASLTVNVAENDTPAIIVQKLVNAFNTASASGNSAYNCNLAPAEVVSSTGTRNIVVSSSATGINTTAAYTYEYASSKITVLPKNYDNALDVAVVTLFLESPTQADPTVFVPGIKGILYGTSSSSSQLTNAGPHSMAIDLKTGKTATISSTSTTGQPVSDMLFFQGTSTAAGTLVYNIRGGRTAPIQRTVNIPLNTDPLKIVELLAADIGTVAQVESTALLAAIRPSTKLTLNGTVETAPGIEFVAFQLSTEETKILFTLESVPAGVTFAVVPSSLAVNGEFDARPKTVVVDFTMARVSKTLDTSSSSAQSKGSVKISTHIPSPGLKSILDQLRNSRDGGNT